MEQPLLSERYAAILILLTLLFPVQRTRAWRLHRGMREKWLHRSSAAPFHRVLRVAEQPREADERALPSGNLQKVAPTSFHETEPLQGGVSCFWLWEDRDAGCHCLVHSFLTP